MKQINLKQNYLLVVLLIITTIICLGCAKKFEKFEKELSKNGSYILENIWEIDHKYYDDLFSGYDVEGYLARTYGYTGEITQEALQKAYRLSFYFNDDTVNNTDTDDVALGIVGMVLLPCDSSLEKDDFKQYPIYQYAYKSQKIYGVHFKIEDLEEIGYITNYQTEQKDLCLFQKEFNEGMSRDYSISSNKLIYKAQEINEIMDEYEALR